MADNRAPDWAAFGAAIAGIIAAIGGVATIMRRTPSPTPSMGTEQAVNGLLNLIEQLQEERNRLEARATACLTEVSELRSKIAALESQVRMLSWPSPGNPPASLEGH